MKKIMKRNQVIVTSLAVLVAIAGYLNFADVKFGNREKEASIDSASILNELDAIEYNLTDQSALLAENGTLNSDALSSGTEETVSIPGETGTPGEAILTEAAAFAAQAKLGREQLRSQNKADLQAILDNQQIEEEQKQQAVSEMVSITQNAEREAAAELLLEAKGFQNVIVNLTGDTADVVVPDVTLTDTMRTQIEDIVKRKAQIEAPNIVITTLNQAVFQADSPEAAEVDTGDTSEPLEEETWSDDWTMDYEDTFE